MICLFRRRGRMSPAEGGTLGPNENWRHLVMYPRSEILFPHRCVSTLKRMRGPDWQELVGRIAGLPDTHPDSLAFALMMIKLSGMHIWKSKKSVSNLSKSALVFN